MRTVEKNRAINSQLTDSQYEFIVNKVLKTLPVNEYDEVEDFDDIFFGGYRVCVDFQYGIVGNIELEDAYILNSDWEVIPVDTAIFKNELSKALHDFNCDTNDLYRTMNL